MRWASKTRDEIPAMVRVAAVPNDCARLMDIPQGSDEIAD